jgi:protocatechuate 3,4-dioxygenase beta subunit
MASSSGPPRPAPPPPEDTALLARARSALESKSADTSAVLCDPAYFPIHARTEFRELIAKHAVAAPLTICSKEEPGPRLDLTLEILDQSERPIPDALVYIYHTSAKGWYSDKGAHIQANSGDVKHARLFGYARTDSRGRLLIHTIRPSGYPNSDLPAHIHLGLTVKGAPIGIGEVRFDDDPRLTPEMRKRSLDEGDRVVATEKLPSGSQSAKASFRVDVPSP